jgi:penicillin-binding protein-related factor A (putative recombinase)
MRLPFKLTPPPDPLEKDIRSAILAWLSTHPKYCVAWQNDSMGVWDEKKKIYRKNRSQYFRKGVSDILGVWKGWPLAIEVKRRGNKTTPEQDKFLADFKRYGGIAIVAYSLQDVINEINKFEEEQAVARAQGGLITQQEAKEDPNHSDEEGCL